MPGLEELTKEWQVKELEKPVLPSFIRQEKEVHGKFTSVDYVRLMLNHVFPASWNFEMVNEPSRLDLNINTALYVCIGRLTVIYADGTKSTHEAPGAVKLNAGWNKKENKPVPVVQANINQHIMGYLGCRSSALKSCAADLGPVFRPLSDDKVSEFIYERDQKRKVEDLKEKHGIDVSQESPGKSIDDLFGEESEMGPGDISELYQMAFERLGLNSKHAANILKNWLTEQHNTENIGAFVKTSPDNIAVLWAVLEEYQAAKGAELT